VICGVSWERYLALDKAFVPEVWFWRRQALEIFALDGHGVAYEAVSQSRLLPSLDIALLERYVAVRSRQRARRAFRDGLATLIDP
jgi:hypothetical protein